MKGATSTPRIAITQIPTMAEIDCLDCGARMDMVDTPDTPGPITYECPECFLSTSDDCWLMLQTKQ